MTAEQGRFQEKLINIPSVGQVDFAVSGLRAEDAIGRNGEVEISSNLADPLIQERIEGVLSQERYRRLVEGIKSGEMLAFASFRQHMRISLVVISASALAAAAAYEFGVRHGRDVREIIDFLKPEDKNKTDN